MAFPAEEGRVILMAGVAHLSCEADKSNSLEECKGYLWYYFTPSGIYVQNSRPAALRFIQRLPQASGNSLVDLVAWMSGGYKPSHSTADYYLDTQVREKPACAEMECEPHALASLMDAGKNPLAVFLRDSESDRQAALVGFRWARKETGKHGYDVDDKIREIGHLVNNSGRYSQALKKIEKMKTMVGLSQKKPPAVSTSFPSGDHVTTGMISTLKNVWKNR
jgi:hypothetical protein